jgi:multiple sugar transport system permease protein
MAIVEVKVPQLSESVAEATLMTWKKKPLMAPITIGALIIRLIEASKIMDTVYVLTSGGPGTATETSSYYIYIRGLRDFQIGYSAALSLVYLVIMIISLTVIAKLLMRTLVGKDG